MVQKKDTLGAEKIPVITSKTHYDFSGKNMTAFGGTFLVGSLIEKLGFVELIEKHLTITRQTEVKAPNMIVALLLLLFIGYERLNHVVYLSGDVMIKRLLGITKLPVQSTFWRFLNKSLHKHNERQLQQVQHSLRSRVWNLSNIQFNRMRLNTDTTASIVYGDRDGARVGYCPTKKGAKCFRPIITSISETGEIVLAQQRRGDRIGGIETAKHLKRVFKALPSDIEKIWRADSEFYCKEAVIACESELVSFIISVKKTAPVQELISKAVWKESKTCDGVSEFMYQPHGWKKPYRFVVARYEKEPQEQTDLFEDATYKYRAFVTDLAYTPEKTVVEYDGRAGIENLIEEAKNQVALSKIPGKNFIATSLFLQLVVLTFNFERYLQLFGREKNDHYHNEEMKTIRQKTIYISAKISDHSRKTIIHFGNEYPLKGWFKTLMKRLRAINLSKNNLFPVISKPLIFNGLT